MMNRGFMFICRFLTTQFCSKPEACPKVNTDRSLLVSPIPRSPMGVPNDVYKENKNSDLAPAVVDCYKSLVLWKRESGWRCGDGEIDGKLSSHVCYGR